MRFGALAAGAALILSGEASAQTEQQLQITIYNNDQALVEDSRVLNLRAGRQKLDFPGVSAEIQPETALLQADGLTILEQNFDFDLLTPYKMMEKAVGSKVRIVRTNPSNGREETQVAEILSANQGVVMRVDGRIEVLRDDGLPVRVLFDEIPENLRARPTLSVSVDAERAGARPGTLRYLTRGIDWSADYVGVFDEKAGRLDLQGWITLTNTSGTAYPNARTQLIAGSPGGGGGYGGSRGGRGGAGDTAFGDYHIYTLPQPTTIAENQTKQVSFLDANGVVANKIYDVERSGYGNDDYAQGAMVRLAFANSAQAGLGAALPAGTVRLYARDQSGRAQFIGEDNIGHIAEGSELLLDVGTAFDVTTQATIVAREQPAETVAITSMSYVFRNARAEPVTIRFQQSGIDGDHELRDSSLPAAEINANTLEWSVPVPARGETVLTFTLREGRRR
jgi:hypothetical protein